MFHDILVICRELVAYRILVTKPCLCHIGIEVDLVYAMLLEYLAEIRVEHVKRGIELSRLALDTMLTHDLFCLLFQSRKMRQQTGWSGTGICKSADEQYAGRI